MFVYLVLSILVGFFCIYLNIICSRDQEEYDSLAEIRAWKLFFRFVVKIIKHGRNTDARLVSIAGGTASNESSFTPSSNHRIRVNGIRIDPENLAVYKKLCGCNTLDNVVPVCYVESLFSKLLLMLGSSTKFCISPIGLIHIKQTIRQHEALDRYLKTDLIGEATVKQYRKSLKGVEVDIQLCLLTTTHCVWEGVVTFLSRDPQFKSDPRLVQERNDDCTYQYVDGVDVPENCGLAFANLTGAWNRFHLYPWTARLLGFKRPIAFGMWTLARAIAQIQNSNGVVYDGKLEVMCNFKRPLLLPGRMLIKYDEPSAMNSNAGCRVLVEDEKTEVPHLVATVKRM